ncbi:putative pantetheine-phosphate adenylyltransferase family protein [Rosellinia necatrix]|uniref:Putative pantetheine-phosphate adenylyltransferase family protein n=1 Tax=Rosellinia necatrix TaxID=77044 RepID=A0A1S7UM48_ROSNE|nr:putative pantetheine-phosphate adenylyltransferase family protein [Rosellinia necatrix]
MEDHGRERRDPSLLLLPPPPHPTNHRALSAAYEPPISAAIAKLKDGNDHENDRGTVLFVGIVSPVLSLTGLSPHHHKSLSWATIQSTLARVYSIVAVVCARLSVPSEMHAGPDSIDVRVLFVDHNPSEPPAEGRRPAIAIGFNDTIIVDLPTFTSAYHPWKQIFHVNSEPGRQVLSSYLKLYEHVQAPRQHQLVVVDSGISLTENPSSPPQSKTYPVVCLGGTFDHLHAGHKLLLTAAAILLKVPEDPEVSPARFIIGITGDELLKRKKYAEFVQPWDLRVANVIEFLASMLHLSKSGWAPPDVTNENDKAIARFRDGTIEVHCVVLRDAFGPTVTEEEMDVLVVSGETRSGGNAVNARRKDLGWHDLEIFEVDVLDAEDCINGSAQTKTDFTTKISSTTIRERKAEARK